ncbi:MAG: hypothetical protein A2V70_12700 [Planctomycetes bacterium RBG_13_63_9]|nr:MAG: hypothetical protein A2V70_12700 [Planctomycetes bacterium RBG_13_63_9]
MSNFHEFVSATLADKRITDSEVPLIRERLYQDGCLDLEDVQVLVELYCGASEYCPAFEELFFSVLEEVFLVDDEIQPAEQFYLLKMLYSDREIRDREKDFLLKLKQTASHTTPEFEALCDEALRAHPTAWSVGGR